MNPPFFVVAAVTKVIIMTYMRSGSTFLGELFDQNPAAFYWFEPIDGVFSHLYGTSLGRFPIEMTQHLNGSDRCVHALIEPYNA